MMHWIIPVLVAASSFGAANGCAFTGGRYFLTYIIFIFTAFINIYILTLRFSHYDEFIKCPVICFELYCGDTATSTAAIRFELVT